MKKIIALMVYLFCVHIIDAQSLYKQKGGNWVNTYRLINFVSDWQGNDYIRVDTIPIKTVSAITINESDMDGKFVWGNSVGEDYYNKYYKQIYAFKPSGSSGVAYQDGIFIKHPGNDSLYYTFDTEDDYINKNIHNYDYTSGLRWRILNMNLDSGRGDMQPNSQGVVLDDYFMDAHVVVPHTNLYDMWLLNINYHNSNYYALKVTDQGLDTNVVKSQSWMGNTVGRNYAQMKVSTDFKTIAFYRGGDVELAHFDQNSGKVGVYLQFYPGFFKDVHGLEFSPNGKYLYISEAKNLWRFNISLGVDTLINQSAEKIYSSNSEIWQLQLGPDCKVYVNHYPPSGKKIFLGAVNFPNQVNCYYVDTLIDLTGQAGLLLPNIPRHYYKWKNSFGVHTMYGTCEELSRDFWYQSAVYMQHVAGKADWSYSYQRVKYNTSTQKYDTSWVDYYQQAFGASVVKGVKDFPLGTQNFGADTVIRVKIKAVIYNSCNDTMPDTFFKDIKVYPVPTAKLPMDTLLCSGQNLTLHCNPQHASYPMHYTWSTGDTTESITVTQPGSYWVGVMWGCHIVYDTINVGYFGTVTLGADTQACDQPFALIGDSVQGAKYIWNTGDSSAYIQVSTAGTFILKAYNKQGCASIDTLQVSFYQTPKPELGRDTSLCDGQALTLDAGTALKYSWNTGDTLAMLSVSATGTYTVTAANGQCAASDSISISYLSYPVVNLGNDTSLCTGDILLLDAQNVQYPCLWSSGSKQHTLAVSKAGTYWARVNNQQCQTTDSIEVGFWPLPKPILFKSGDSLWTDGFYNTYQWRYNGNALAGATDSLLLCTKHGNYQVEVTDTNGCVGVSNVKGMNVGVSTVTLSRDGGGLRVYPNPANTILYFALSNVTLSQTTYKAEVSTIEGKTLITENLTGNSLNLTSLSAGLYFLKITPTNGNPLLARFVKE